MLDEKDLELLSGMFSKLDSKIDTLDSKIDRTRNEVFAYLELKIDPQFKLLAEGQQTILDTLTPKTETEKLREENELFRMAIADLSRRVLELESKVS